MYPHQRSWQGLLQSSLSRAVGTDVLLVVAVMVAVTVPTVVIVTVIEKGFASIVHIACARRCAEDYKDFYFNPDATN